MASMDLVEEREDSMETVHSNGHRSSEPTTSEDGTADKRSKVCRVCGDKALSVNFNVVTCESCKAFFRRNALKPKAFRCPFNGDCEINVVSRKFCKKCRLRKCFEVGMMKEWIMSDEARIKKRELINMNRERRRAIIMATAAKHVAQGRIGAQEMTANMFTEQESNAYPIDARRKSDEYTMCSSPAPLPHDPSLAMRKSELIELMLRCGCPCEDGIGAVIDEFADRHTIHAKLPMQEEKEDAGHCRCDAALAEDTQVPTNCDNRHMLTFLAPRVGKQWHAVAVDAEDIKMMPQQQSATSHWPDLFIAMPTMALDVPPFLHDTAQRSFQHTPILSCSLPVKPAVDVLEPPYPHGKPVSQRQKKLVQEPLGLYAAGELHKLPHTMLPVLHEPVETKKGLQQAVNEYGDGEMDEKKATEANRRFAAFVATAAAKQLII